MPSYTVFDVETPNYANDRISAIGITKITDNKITGDYYTLVNPETHFDSFNIRLTGITPEAVEDKPTFPELWEKIEPTMKSGILVAHNAQFDMSVLAKCLKFYGIDAPDYFSYACTCRMGRKCLPGMVNYKLDTLCDELNIELDHHNAGSDSSACAQLLLHYLNGGADISGFIRRYDMRSVCTVKR